MEQTMKIETDTKVETDTKKSSFLNRVRVKTKILIGFAAVLVVLGAVATMGYTSLVTISHEVELYSHEVEASEAAASVEAHFFELEIFVREFAATSNMEDVKKAREIADIDGGIVVAFLNDFFQHDVDIDDEFLADGVEDLMDQLLELYVQLDDFFEVLDVDFKILADFSQFLQLFLVLEQGLGLGDFRPQLDGDFPRRLLLKSS